MNGDERAASKDASGQSTGRASAIFMEQELRVKFRQPRFLSALILLVAHMLHPVDYLPLELLLDGDVRHGCG